MGRITATAFGAVSPVPPVFSCQSLPFPLFRSLLLVARGGEPRCPATPVGPGSPLRVAALWGRPRSSSRSDPKVDRDVRDSLFLSLHDKS